MLFFSHRLQTVLRELLVPHGFVPSPTVLTFQRQYHSLTQMVSFLVDPRGDLDILALSANLSVGISRSLADPLVARERLLSGWGANGGARESGLGPVVTRNIGYLMPGHEWHEWEIDIHSSPDRVANDMIASVVRFGLPWLERFLSPTDVVLESRRAMLQGVHDLNRRPMRRVPLHSTSVLGR